MTAKIPTRRRYSADETVSGRDWSTQSRDLDDFLNNLVPFAKLSYSGYAIFPIRLAVAQAPWAIIAVRIVPHANAQAAAPQGGFCAFAYDGNARTANVSSINALDSLTATALPTSVIYDFNFLAVF